jgi:hypothetical protein
MVRFELTNKIREFNDVIKEFCDGFENPKIRTSGDIIKYNVEHAETAIPERKSSGYDAEAAKPLTLCSTPESKGLDRQPQQPPLRRESRKSVSRNQQKSKERRHGQIHERE